MYTLNSLAFKGNSTFKKIEFVLLFAFEMTSKYALSIWLMTVGSRILDHCFHSLFSVSELCAVIVDFP